MRFRALIVFWGALACLAPAPGLARAEAEAEAGAEAKGARDYLVHSWRTEDGLPQNWVTSIAQTPDGYLWVGTRYGGLARFDGLRFVHFNPQNTAGLPDMQIERLAVDSRGTMWIATTDQSVSAMRDGRFEVFRKPRTQPELRLASVLRAGTDGVVTFNTESGDLARLDRGRGLEGWEIFKPALAAKTFLYNIYPPETFCRGRDDSYWYVNERRQLARMSAAGGDVALPGALRAAHANTRVNAIGTDARGVLWIVTDEKIFSWDGQVVADRTPVATSSGTLPGTRDLAGTRQIAFGGDGGVWIADGRQLRKLFPASAGTRTQLQAIPRQDACSLSGTGCQPVVLDAQMSADNSPRAAGPCHDEGNRFQVATTATTTTTATAATVATATAASRATNATTAWTWVAVAGTPPVAEALSGRHNRLYADSRGGAWVVSYGHGLLHARGDGGARLLTERDGLPSTLLTCWFEDSEGNVWIGTTGDGLARIRERAFRSIGMAEGMPEKVVCSVGVDAGGDIWAGTISGQLTRWSGGRARVLSLPPADTTPIGGFAVWPGKSGDAWAGSFYHGLVRYHAGELVGQIPLRDGKFVRVLFEDTRGNLWIGQFEGLCRYADGKIDYFRKDQGFQPNTAVGALAEDAEGALWIGVESGDLWRYRDGAFTCYPHPADWPRARCVSLQTDSAGVVWMGTLGNGLVRFQDGRFTRFGVREGLPDDNVSQLLDDHAGNLWGGTYSGIFRVAKTALNDRATATTGSAAGAATTASGATTAAGAAATKTSPLICTTYGYEDGLPALECTAGFNPACWRATDGRLLFTTVNGLVVVNPADVTPNPAPPRIIIEELQIDGTPRALAPPTAPAAPTAPAHAAHADARAPDAARATAATAPLEIAPGKHFLQFRYTGLSFSAPEKVRFLWKLDGVNRDWQDAGTQRAIGIGPLPPGAYRLRVRAANSDGVWSENGAALAFRVLPWFWETAWFRATAAAAVLALIALAVAQTQRQRYRRRLRDAERQRQLEQERARIARDLHDDLGTSLMQISLLSTLANGPKTPPAEKQEIIHRVDTRAREMIGALDEIVWAVNPKNDSWYELANYLGFYAEEFFHPAGIRCRMTMPGQLPQTPLSSETRHHLFLAFKEALNNVAKHSGAKQALVRIETGAVNSGPARAHAARAHAAAGEVRFVVEDDGRGLDTSLARAPVPSRPAGGNGLQNMRRRMEQIGGSLEIEPAAGGRGTRVILRVPV